MQDGSLANVPLAVGVADLKIDARDLRDIRHTCHRRGSGGTATRIQLGAHPAQSDCLPRPKHHDAVRGEGAILETTHKLAPTGPSETKLSLDAPCRHRGYA